MISSIDMGKEFIRRMGDVRIALIGKGVVTDEAALQTQIWNGLYADVRFAIPFPPTPPGMNPKDDSVG